VPYAHDVALTVKLLRLGTPVIRGDSAESIIYISVLNYFKSFTSCSNNYNARNLIYVVCTVHNTENKTGVLREQQTTAEHIFTNLKVLLQLFLLFDWSVIFTSNVHIVFSNTRFRWKQVLSGSAEREQSWAIDDIYVGAACHSFCNGHGICDFPTCICEQGFVGNDCSVSSNPKVNMFTLTKIETINFVIHSNNLWRRSVTNPCYARKVIFFKLVGFR
jgi:hypothetical protein